MQGGTVATQTVFIENVGLPTQAAIHPAIEGQTIARACGENHVHNLEPEDLVALTVEAAATARVPLAGTNWIPGL